MGLKTALRCLAVCASFAPNIAVADWQFTKWNMTPAQIISASKGKMRACDAGCDKQSSATLKPEVYGPYISGEFRFTAFAMFSRANGAFNEIHLRLDNPELGFRLAAELRAKYGTPANHTRSAITENYEWRDARDEISLFLIGNEPSSASLRYRPRVTASNRGL